MIPLDLHAQIDPLLTGDSGQRARLKWGLTIAAACVLWLVAQKVVFMVAWTLHAPIAVRAYIWLAIARSACWFVAVIFVTPPSMDVVIRGGRMLRMLARGSQALWLAAGVAWLMELNAGPLGLRLGTMTFWMWTLAGAAGCGAMLLALILQQAADTIELDDASRRIGLAMLVTPVLAIVLALIPLQTNFLMLALFGPLLFAWGWYLAGFARGLWEMRQHVAWGMSAGYETGDREARIAQRRAELDREARAMIRALPVPPHAPPTAPQPARSTRL